MKPYKKVPSFWMDLEDGVISLESDHPDYKVICKIPYQPGKADLSMDIAGDLIKDFEAGRKDFRTYEYK